MAAPSPSEADVQELEVQAAWHEQVHQSRVAALSFTPGDATLLSGCDAAAPKPAALADSDDPPLAVVDPLNGIVLSRPAGMPACNVRLLLPLPAGSKVLCVAGDGSLLVADLDPATLHSTAALPGMPGMAASVGAAAAAPVQAAGSQQEGSSVAEAGQGWQGSQQARTSAAASQGMVAPLAPQDQEGAATSTGPEFIAELGYRGHREGYLFREGSLGAGYYRKDVVRRYCTSAATALPGEQMQHRKQHRQQHATGAAPSAGSNAAAALPGGSTSSSGAGSQLSGEQARRYIQQLLEAAPSMHCVVASPDGDLLYTTSLGHSDCAVRVWQLQPDGSSACTSASASSSSSSPGLPLQAELHRTLHGHTAPTLSLTLSPNGSLLFSGSHDHSIRVWSTADWSCVRTLRGHGGGVRALAVAPGGAVLYSAAADNTIRAWSTEHWVCLRTLHGRHEDTTWPACLALSPDGSLLASGSTGPFGASTLKLFQTANGRGREAGACLASFAQLRYDQKGGITALLFSSDGASLYSGASDGTVAAWRIGWQAPPADTRRVGLRTGFFS